MRKKIIVITSLIFILCTHLSFAEQENKFAEEHLYKKGLQALKENDYVSALKYLYAFRVINKARFEHFKELEVKIDTHIAFCEDVLKGLDYIKRIIVSSTSTASTAAGKTDDLLEKLVVILNAQGYERPDLELEKLEKEKSVLEKKIELEKLKKEYKVK